MITFNYPLYDLTSHHFQRCQIVLKNDKSNVISGQFVGFKVITDIVEHFYPQGEVLCYLPSENVKEFWAEYNKTGGSFAKIPKYIIPVSIKDILEIKIFPV